mmetsp:Transcript_100080/g.278836  ORF Transcript_100080/g.278836 Transcript_100080/m.278836 type:complete len:227 (-) Transcript_100080:502-1182(-)
MQSSAHAALSHRSTKCHPCRYRPSGCRPASSKVAAHWHARREPSRTCRHIPAGHLANPQPAILVAPNHCSSPRFCPLQPCRPTLRWRCRQTLPHPHLTLASTAGATCHRLQEAWQQSPPPSRSQWHLALLHLALHRPPCPHNHHHRPPLPPPPHPPLFHPSFALPPFPHILSSLAPPPALPPLAHPLQPSQPGFPHPPPPPLPPPPPSCSSSFSSSSSWTSSTSCL